MDKTLEPKMFKQDTQHGTEITYFLDDTISDPHNYRELSNVLLTASENDIVHLILNGPGGRMDTMIQLCNLISICKAEVQAHLTAEVSSAHATIFLQCNSWVVHPLASLMLHCYSGGGYGKGDETMQQGQHWLTLFSEISEEIYYPFLSREEIAEMIINKKDFYFTSKEIKTRLDKVIEFREAKLEELANEEGMQQYLILKEKFETLE